MKYYLNRKEEIKNKNQPVTTMNSKHLYYSDLHVRTHTRTHAPPLPTHALAVAKKKVLILAGAEVV